MVEWEDGQIVQGPYVVINGTQYPVVMPEYTGNTPMTAENLNKMQTDAQEELNQAVTILKGTTLYENALGSEEDITLNDDVSNYKYVEIFYRTNDGSTAQGSVKVSNPNGQYVILQRPTINGSGTGYYIKAKEVHLLNDQILNNGNRYVQASLTSSVSVTNNNYIYIQKVVGYKEG